MLAQVLFVFGPLTVAGLFVTAGLLAAIGPRKVAPVWALIISMGALGVALALALVSLTSSTAQPMGAIAAPLAQAFLVDSLSATLLVLVGFLGVTVIKYSDRYLDGHPRQPRFIALLCLAVAAVAVLVTSDDLLLLTSAWIISSLIVHFLLTFDGARRQAVAAARKKFVIARLSDLSLLVAVVILITGFETRSMTDIMQIVRTDGSSLPAGIGPAALFIAIAAILKSAQFPTHIWLTEVMEAPTPVSALLHAGVVNAGGFLLIRFADLLLLSPITMFSIATVGGLTAIIGALMMSTQTSVKSALAMSTVAQMGFMIFQCGIGAFSSAALHLVAHSLYKAHAFLAAGTPMARKIPTAVPSSIAALAFVTMGGLYVGIAALLGKDLWVSPAIAGLGMIVVFGITSFAAPLFRRLRTVPFALLGGVGVTLIYFTLQSLTAQLLQGIVPPPGSMALNGLISLVAMVALCGAATFAQATGALTLRQRDGALYLLLFRGFYINTLWDRIISLWPTHSVTSHRRTSYE
ncbi:possible NADH-Ubiquinone/plastoquinone (complex I) [Parvularcula bermudensis HTCC2503]|uniref:Probable inorganic carbon transporter subunit DabB n=1 Tax=Parvularcula bermudensis (strain ATCC BAA-594 / HTCC2503 / KCTC 12087) TaxID=314260 RepID=E0THE7_PARBH|nr:proton-conducting transporter membrane subunit [Parvularcula bermudensis]ADM10739.1 possible NADH-Ubiquinone/plastoquinone (complex I) [Parvularcula bermudensis HTCC2503]